MIAYNAPQFIFLTKYSDLCVVDLDVIDDSTKIRSARLSIASGQFFPYKIDEVRNFLDGHFFLWGEFSPRSFHRLVCDVALGSQVVEAFGETGVGSFDDASFDELQKAAQFCFDVAQLSFVLCEAVADRGGLCRLPLLQLLKELGHPFLGQQVFHDGGQNKVIDLLHPDSATLAGSLALPHAATAGVVAVFSALAGADNHAAAAACAGGEAAQQNGTAHGPGRHLLRVSGLERAPDLIEVIGGDDRWHRDQNGFRNFAVPIAPVFPLVDGVGERPVNRSYAPFRSLARPVAMVVEPFGDPLDAHRAARSIALEIELKHEADDFRLVLSRHKLLLACATPLLDFDGLETKGHSAAIEVALPGILRQGTRNVFTGLLGIILIEEGHDPTDHLAQRAIFELLGDTDQSNTALRKRSDAQLGFNLIAEEAAEGMHDDDVEGHLAVVGAVHHPLELRPFRVGAGSRVLELLNDAPTLCRAVVA